MVDVVLETFLFLAESKVITQYKMSLEMIIALGLPPFSVSYNFNCESRKFLIYGAADSDNGAMQCMYTVNVSQPAITLLLELPFSSSSSEL